MVVFLLSNCPFKGTVSPDIAFYFRVYQFNSVPDVRLLMVFKMSISHFFMYLNIHFKTASMKKITNYADPF
jgi:hypothetical protein